MVIDLDQLEINGVLYQKLPSAATSTHVLNRPIFLKNLSEALRVLRALKNKDLKIAAKESSVNRNTLAWLESGEQTSPSKRVLARLEEYYGVKFNISLLAPD